MKNLILPAVLGMSGHMNFNQRFAAAHPKPRKSKKSRVVIKNREKAKSARKARKKNR